MIRTVRDLVALLPEDERGVMTRALAAAAEHLGHAAQALTDPQHAETPLLSWLLWLRVAGGGWSIAFERLEAILADQSTWQDITAVAAAQSDVILGQIEARGAPSTSD